MGVDGNLMIGLRRFWCDANMTDPLGLSSFMTLTDFHLIEEKAVLVSCNVFTGITTVMPEGFDTFCYRSWMG